MFDTLHHYFWENTGPAGFRFIMPDVPIDEAFPDNANSADESDDPMFSVPQNEA